MKLAKIIFDSCNMCDSRMSSEVMSCGSGRHVHCGDDGQVFHIFSTAGRRPAGNDRHHVDLW